MMRKLETIRWGCFVLLVDLALWLSRPLGVKGSTYMESVALMSQELSWLSESGRQVQKPR